jgi:hypothetical protein
MNHLLGKRVLAWRRGPAITHYALQDLAPFSMFLTADAQEPQDDNQTQGYAEQPKKNQNHDRPPFSEAV